MKKNSYRLLAAGLCLLLQMGRAGADDDQPPDSSTESVQTNTAASSDTGQQALSQLGVASALTSTLVTADLLEAHGPMFLNHWPGLDVGARVSSAIEVESSAFPDYAKQELLLSDGGIINTFLSFRRLDVVASTPVEPDVYAPFEGTKESCKELAKEPEKKPNEETPKTAAQDSTTNKKPADDRKTVETKKRSNPKEVDAKKTTLDIKTHAGSGCKLALYSGDKSQQSRRIFKVDRWYLPSNGLHGAYGGQDADELWFYVPWGIGAQGVKKAQNSDGMGLGGMGTAYIGIGFDGPLTAFTGSDPATNSPTSGWIDVQARAAAKFVNKSTLRTMFGDDHTYANQFVTAGVKASIEVTGGVTLAVEYEAAVGGANHSLLKDTALFSINVPTK